MPPAQKPWVQRYSDAEIEALARAICENLGLDPDEPVQADFDRFMLIGEFRGVYVYDVPGDRWQLYRKDAQMALATRDALNTPLNFQIAPERHYTAGELCEIYDHVVGAAPKKDEGE